VISKPFQIPVKVVADEALDAITLPHVLLANKDP
jgi:hypothetical protein